MSSPIALHGISVGSARKPEGQMEVIYDQDLCIWLFQLRPTATLDKISVLEMSERFSKVLSGGFSGVYRHL